MAKIYFKSLRPHDKVSKLFNLQSVSFKTVDFSDRTYYSNGVKGYVSYSFLFTVTHGQ